MPDPDNPATRKRLAGHNRGAGDDDAPEPRRRIAGERPRPSTERSQTPTEPQRPADKDSDDARSLAERLAAAKPDRLRVLATANAAGVGLVVGVVLTTLVYAGMQAFRAIYNTPSGDGVGAVVLCGVLLIATVVGAYLLQWRGLPDPSATTILGVLLIIIVTLAALLPIVFSVWMLLITPLLGAISYAVSHLAITRLSTRS